MDQVPREPFNVYHTHVRAHQTDLNAAMYHGAFLDVFDDARIETFRRIGYDYERMLGAGWTPVIRRLECDFLAAARMDDALEITVHVAAMSVATMTLRYRGVRTDRLLAEAHVTFAFLDARSKPIRFPPDLREVIERHPDFMASDSALPAASHRSRASAPPV